MTISANMHRATDMRAFSINGAEWLKIEGEGGEYIAVFMPLSLATAIAEVFTAHRTDHESSIRSAFGVPRHIMGKDTAQ